MGVTDHGPGINDGVFDTEDVFEILHQMFHNLLMGFRWIIEGDITDFAEAVKTQGFGQLVVSCLVDRVEILRRNAVNEDAELSIFIDEPEILVWCGSWRAFHSNVSSNDEPNSIAVNVVQILCDLLL